MVENLLGS
ncbi:UNVERIFIED_CONTAM: hypothetical protein GTU68_064895 [Idotea baltica]|nr:hypothetical protein [Idotea baltica]